MRNKYLFTFSIYYSKNSISRIPIFFNIFYAFISSYISKRKIITFRRYSMSFVTIIILIIMYKTMIYFLSRITMFYTFTFNFRFSIYHSF
ncbi:MAG: hypothetical protein [crAssphage sp. isolate ctcc615]|uniref:Uncharacterized protein n=1 Tax=crAssphage sp. isolate ctcc615 TaxID=2989853 RepID=A0A345BNX0_9CAUD|nr:MAG: hypothetical protein KNU00_gp18 [crAssphage sp. isolate ctcc615]AXF52141.1 MAG: hypothetical protein [crAssphage sp. isolate ctcc615]